MRMGAGRVSGKSVLAGSLIVDGDGLAVLVGEFIGRRRAKYEVPLYEQRLAPLAASQD
jgi:hypothetical protein